MSRRGFPKRQQYPDGHRILLEAALRVFQRKGFEGATVEAICSEAGYSKGGFYFHFSGKNALIDELLKGAPANVSRNGHLFRSGADSLLPQLWAESRNDAVKTWLVEHHSRRLAHMRKGIRTLVRHHDPDVLARLILALEAGLQVQRQIMTSPSERRQIRRALRDLMLEPAAPAAA
jgi:AcrR family transcriptional regulator